MLSTNPIFPPKTVYLCVPYGSRNRLRSSILTRQSPVTETVVFTVRYALSCTSWNNAQCCKVSAKIQMNICWLLSRELEVRSCAQNLGFEGFSQCVLLFFTAGTIPRISSMRPYICWLLNRELEVRSCAQNLGFEEFSQCVLLFFTAGTIPRISSMRPYICWLLSRELEVRSCAQNLGFEGFSQCVLLFFTAGTIPRTSSMRPYIGMTPKGSTNVQSIRT